VGGALIAAVALAGGAALALGGGRIASVFASRPPEGRPPLAAATSQQSTASPAATAGHVEIPDVGGMPLTQAETLLQAANLAVRVSVIATAAASAEQDVESQEPVPGVVVGAGSVVALRVPGTAKPSVAPKPGSKGRAVVVVIDPGHQSRPDPIAEPIGPGSPITQAKSTAGSTGSATGIPEYEIDLQIATNLKDRLTAAGVRVVMTRTTNDVDISNAQRAQIANAAKATLFVRIHADSEIGADQTGVTTVYPAANQWTKPISAASRKAAELVQGAVVASTEARDNGEVERGDQAGFNWSTVPCILVNTGNPANSVEDRLLTSAHYQDLVAEGLASGILDFCGKGQ
jgi:N-acetylmuramoyl-L-alanine amidase